MGYESRVVIVDRHNFNGYVFGEEIARVDLSCMGYEFCEIFHNPIDFNLYRMRKVEESPNEFHENEYYREDCYGNHCNWATLDEVKNWLETAKDGDEPIMNYRRASVLYGIICTLKANEDAFGQLCVVHYGY